MIGKSPAKRPYMYLPLKGDTNDYSTNAQNPSNTGVTTTTGQFGESNGAYEWNSNTDTIYQNSTIADTIRGYFNNSFTLYVWLYPTDLSITRRILNSGQFDYGFSIRTYVGDVQALQIFTYQASSTFVSKNSSNYVYSTNNWQCFILKSSDNSINLDILAYETNTEIFNDTITKATYDSNNNFAIGNDGNGNSSLSYRGKMHTFRIYDVTLSDGALKILNNEKGRISLPKKLLLDNYSGSAVAYSLRKLRYNYSGSAIRVRRASDNAEQDIGFVSNELDTSSLASFCSGTNGFVVTWYDQSGNGNNMVQSTTASQPKIYDSSTGVLLENGKPTIQFDGSIDWLDISITKPARFSIYSVMKLDSNTTTFSGFGSGNSLGQNKTMWGMLVFRNTSKVVTSWGDDTNYSDYISNSAITTTSQDLYNVLYDSGLNVYIYKDNSSVALSVESSSSATTSAGTSYKFSIGRLGEYNGFYLDGNVQELVLYTSYQGTNNSAINTNINNYYGIY